MGDYEPLAAARRLLPGLTPDRATGDVLELTRRVLADPWDDTPRLLLADALDDAGACPEHAALIRLQCGPAAPGGPDPVRRQGLQDLLVKGGTDWAAVNAEAAAGPKPDPRAGRDTLAEWNALVARYTYAGVYNYRSWAAWGNGGLMGWQLETAGRVYVVGAADRPRVVVARGFPDELHAPLRYVVDGGRPGPGLAWPLRRVYVREFRPTLDGADGGRPIYAVTRYLGAAWLTPGWSPHNLPYGLFARLVRQAREAGGDLYLRAPGDVQMVVYGRSRQALEDAVAAEVAAVFTAGRRGPHDPHFLLPLTDNPAATSIGARGRAVARLVAAAWGTAPADQDRDWPCPTCGGAGVVVDPARAAAAPHLNPCPACGSPAVGHETEEYANGAAGAPD